MSTNYDQQASRGWRRAVLTILNVLVLIASATMVVWITRETLANESFVDDPAYMRFQFWVCLLFLTDIVVEWSLSPRKWSYFCRHLLFILVSIPYLNIIQWAGLGFSPEVTYLLKLVPLIRAGYVLAIVVGALTSRRAMSMLWVYITYVAVIIYFASLMFFVEEHHVNPGVDTFWTAMWCAFLDLTTSGTNINPVTPVGKAISLALPVVGLTLCPVFTVYVTNAFLKKNQAENTKSGN